LDPRNQNPPSSLSPTLPQGRSHHFARCPSPQTFHSVDEIVCAFVGLRSGFLRGHVHFWPRLATSLATWSLAAREI
jgi:hypothetical protein